MMTINSSGPDIFDNTSVAPSYSGVDTVLLKEGGR